MRIDMPFNERDDKHYDFLWDWATFVFKVPDLEEVRYYNLCGGNNNNTKVFVEKCLRYLKLDDAVWLEQKHGIYKYEKSRIIAGEKSIVIGYNETCKPGDTVMFQFSGSGMDFWRTYLENKGYSLKQVEAQLYKNKIIKVTPSRLDLTMDLYNFPKEFSPLYVNEVTGAGYYIGRTSPSIFNSYPRSGHVPKKERYASSKEGATMYFGRGGSKQLRIYNKLHERVDKVNRLYPYSAWYRWEFELRGQSAVDVWTYYNKHGQSLEKTWRFWLATNYRWVVPTGKHQEKISRYPSTWWYLELVNGFEDAKKISHKARLASWEKSYSFLENQTANTISRMIDFKIVKYMQNGLSYEDASKSAQDLIFNIFKKAHKTKGFDFKGVANYFSSENDEEQALKYEQLAKEQKEHRDGV